ncbi:MAG: fructosamine kinase family protein [Roseibium sp.]|uniref:fructosamine kinase family protein n=1 Tax=Roseibium sp. TaxID=1936156 RepID=UPI001B13DD82|nr:fructosamine kinase family protein [Roseibium sp.]MBO6890832.1 fructosamine kinase family protein [Roseibium sp.]MBO6933137.1 fructosamine kinase family protein [Roseibium sp.]
MTGSNLINEATRLLGEDIAEIEPLNGGDLSDVVRLRTASGKTLVAKTGPFPEREANMLRAMIAGGANAPAPQYASSRLLVLEDLGPSVSPSQNAWRHLAEILRALHGTTGETFGWPEGYAFDRLAIRSTQDPNWADFWIRNRVLVDTTELPDALVQRLEEVEPIIRAVLPETPAASLLHGDLWTGNVHFTSGDQAHLIDPACYYGHFEVDLAMLTLFGSPPQSFWAAYGPLEPGWETRRHIYQLWPALVHLRLFGAGYLPLVERLLDALGDGSASSFGSS